MQVRRVRVRRVEVRWKKFLAKAGFWLTTEIWLNVLGLDNLADYSEFLIDKELEELAQKNHRTVKISKFGQDFCRDIKELCPVDIFQNRVSETSNHEDYQHRFNTFENKCKKKKDPCIKVWCLPYVRPSWLNYQRL